ncbi:MAG: SGNH/GDSL hydrolase family protein [Prevotella sp.]|nr:SGNH/GDSL hydrolase family protein [Prevotella sp.]
MKRLFIIQALMLLFCTTTAFAQGNTISSQSIETKAATAADAFPERFFHYNIRGSLTNSYLKFSRGGKARVAFLGGSITEMKGWKNMLEEFFKKTFPQTEFEFIEAGIPSMGSTPHSFRMKTDVLRKGKIDLLFVEAAPNDDTNEFTPLEQVRGMEGMVRQAWLADAETDIIMLHFIWDGFINIHKAGRRPDVIYNHERVANHYRVPSIDLNQEINERMEAGQFTWKDFGGQHPAPFGHSFYAATIERMMKLMWNEIGKDAKIAPHELPEKPLDEYSYFGGDFINISEAKLGKGWQIVSPWHPDNKYTKRPGFVDVPMLETKTAGAKLTLDFTGKAIGICCVAGPYAGILEYSIDGKPFKRLDTYTHWSGYLYIPWVYMLETELTPTRHRLTLRMAKDKNEVSLGNECQIRNFVVNK